MKKMFTKFSAFGVSALLIAQTLVFSPGLALAAPEDPGQTCTTINLMSSTDTQFKGLTLTDPAGSSSESLFIAGTPGAAVVATPTGFPGAWDAAAADPDVAGANWVNNSVVQPTNPAGLNPGEDGTVNAWRLFSQSFTIPADAVSISSPILHFTADNSVQAFLDDVSVGTAPDYNVVADSAALPLTTGAHTFKFVVKNDAYDGANNPTGLLYKATVDYCQPNTPPVIAPDACPVDTTPTLVETKTVDSTSYVPTASSNVLSNGGTYLLVASGAWENRNNASQKADAEYDTMDNWATYMNGYDMSDYLLGEGEFDLQVDGAFINWGSYNVNHEYSHLYTGTGNPVNLMVFDGNSNIPQVEPSWYGDNSGSLTVNIYSCVANTPPPTTGTISGMKYNDLNRNGKKDDNEPGLPGWVIRLILENDEPTIGCKHDDDGVVVATATTDANGNYTFTNVAPGTYEVREIHQKGWKRMSKNPKDIVIEAGSVVTGVDFGNALKKKWEREDTDKDDNRHDQFGKYFANHGRSDYGREQNNRDHEQRDNNHNENGFKR